MISRIFTLIICCLPLVSTAQIEFVNTFGGSSSDNNFGIIPHPDGGYLQIGSVLASGGDISTSYGSQDVWVVKTTAAGELEWEKSFGGGALDVPHGIHLKDNGNFIIYCNTVSGDGDISNPLGESDIWIFEIDLDGNLVWEKSIGGSEQDHCYDLVVCPTGGYYLIGSSFSTDGDFTDENNGSGDLFIFKLDEFFDVVWQKYYGGLGLDYGRDAVIGSDGSIYILGQSGDIGSDISVFYGWQDMWVIKLTPDGELVWEKSIGGTLAEHMAEITILPNGNLFIVGDTGSSDYDIEFNYGDFDGLIVILSPDGELQLVKNFGGSGFEKLSGVVLSPTDKVILYGFSDSSDGTLGGNVDPNIGGTDCWMLGLDDEFNVEWQYRFGGTDYDYLVAVLMLSETEFICSGMTRSTDVDMPPTNHGNTDFMIAKLNLVSIIPITISATTIPAAIDFQVFPNPAFAEINILLNESLTSDDLIFELLTIEGKLVGQENIQPNVTTQLEIDHLPAGNYHYQLIEKKSRKVLSSGKILKVK